MTQTAKRKTSLSLDADVLDSARALGINVSSVAEAALRNAVAEARRQDWRARNTDAFAAQADWHARNGHPLSDIIAGSGRATWSE